MSESINDNAMLANLQTLKIYPTLLPAGLDALVVYLRRSSDTLTSLIVKDRYLLYHEVEVVVGVFVHRSPENGLKSLRLNIRTLTAELIDLLAENLPGLQVLELYIGDAITGDNASTIVSGGQALSCVFCANLKPLQETFRTEMEERSYNNWRLCDIGLWQGGSLLSHDTMLLLSRCIPSVRSFWDSGNMKGHHS
jgi:hypothetical protein